MAATAVAKRAIRTKDDLRAIFIGFRRVGYRLADQNAFLESLTNGKRSQRWKGDESV